MAHFRVESPDLEHYSLHDGQVTFRFKDDKREGKLRTQTLDAVEFLRRFVLHVLPRGLHKIRYFGFMANCQRHQRLSHCRTLLGQPAVLEAACEMSANKDAATRSTSQTAIKPSARCPVCQQGRMELIDTLHRRRVAWDLAVPVPALDTS
jgi:Putative transposase